ncbi:MAG: hypothetical protein KDC14_08990 [Planctomycetes bacterium]|nr:hypothetical protein [Planctomycetota bacterium]
MRRECGTWILLAALGVPIAHGQGTGERNEAAPAQDAEPAGVEKITLRVTGILAGGVVTIDRGTADGLREGDRVTLRPLAGKPRPGRVSRVDERSAEVRLEGPGGVIPVGTRGFAQLPAERFATPVAVGPATPQVDETLPEHAPWEYTDDGFEEGMPLLRSIDGVRPQDRAPIVTGRVFSMGDLRLTSDDGRKDGFLRLGTELHYENPAERGGQLYFIGEVNHRMTEVNGQVDESVSIGRLDRLSYSVGGTRFEPSRHEFGRFLHDGVPEFGILDGYEWNQRLEGGHRFGTSVGFLPEPTPKMSTGDDFAVSGFYQWASDERERLTATGAYQKSWHNGDADRDLFVFKLDYWEPEDWDFHATTWVDWYTEGDVGKGAGPELTSVYASSTRRFANGNGLLFTYTHDRLPSVDRYEFPVLDPLLLATERDDRLAGDGWAWVRNDRRLFARSGAWVDQEDFGGDLELGVEQLDVWIDGNRTELSVFGSRGQFSTLLGLRTIYGVQRNLLHWSVSYEYFQSNQIGFTDDNDDLDHHRLLGNLDLTRHSGWNLSLRGGLERWSDEFAGVAGFYLQRSF